MEMLTLIVALSSVIWYLIERGKTEIWGKFSWGKWVTIGLAAIGSFGLTFAFKLDLLYATALTSEVTVAGGILTGLCLMSGSSAIAEIIAKIKG